MKQTSQQSSSHVSQKYSTFLLCAWQVPVSRLKCIWRSVMAWFDCISDSSSGSGSISMSASLRRFNLFYQTAMAENKGLCQIRSKVEPIRFGSEICFKASNNNDFYLYADGFMDSRIFCLDISLAFHYQINFGLTRLIQSTTRPFSRSSLTTATGTSKTCRL